MALRLAAAILATAGALAAPAQAADVGGVVFNDYDANGVRTLDEPGVAGVLVFLDAEPDGLHNAATEPSQQTAADGSWAFTGAATLRVGWLPPANGACTGVLECVKEADPAGAPLELGVQLGGILLDPGGATLVGKARLVGLPGGCVQRSFRARVIGDGIRRVEYRVDGRRVAVRRRPAFAATIGVRRLRAGRHRLTAVVIYGSGDRAPTKRLSRVFRRCGS